MAVATRKRNPTQADVIHTMLVQAEKTAGQKLSELYLATNKNIPNIEELKTAARAERDALMDFRRRVDRYLAGDMSALYG